MFTAIYDFLQISPATSSLKLHGEFELFRMYHSFYLLACRAVIKSCIFIHDSGDFSKQISTL